jgi:hypothetical protein
MNDLKKTGVYVAVAVALLVTAVLAGLPSGKGPRDFDDQGQKFFTDFTLPEQATSLEVVEFDPATGDARPFNVALKDGRWVIPSHYDYPADAKDRLANTAAGVLDLTKDTIRSDRAEDHKDLGVLDPLDPKVLSYEGLGKRITLKDKGDRVLADLIVGKPVPGQAEQRFVRLPGQNRVYGAKLANVDISTRFSDWIETNLLQIRPQAVKTITFYNDKVEIRGRRPELVRGEHITVERAETVGTPPPGKTPPRWKLDDVPPGKEVNTSALDTLTSTLGDLRIVGVRPKPPGLSADLKSASGRIQQDDISFLSLADKGFYITDRGLFSSEGNVYTTTDDGLLYLLHFGKVTFARGEALSAGAKDPAKDVVTSEGEGTPDGAVESRFLFVTVQFQPDVIPPPSPAPVAGELPLDLFAKSVTERASYEKTQAENVARDKANYEKKLEDGKKKADELKARFAGWYYLVPGDAFRKIVLDRDSLTRDPALPTAPSPPRQGGFPGLEGGMPSGLPPGLQLGR